MKIKLILCLMLVLSGEIAGASGFTVSIVGQAQSDKRQSMEEGLPNIYCPNRALMRPDENHDRTSGNGFFVVIQNTQRETDKIAMSASAWYDCLQFKITDSTGKVYAISRRTFAWSANPIETWIFPSGGMRVIAVDFTSDTMSTETSFMGGWQGLPPSPSSREIASMTVTFLYGDSQVNSEPTRVYLCGLPK